MSYLPPQVGEIAADDIRQPTDMTRDGWTSVPNTLGFDSSSQASQGTSWLFRQRPRLRHDGRA